MAKVIVVGTSHIAQQSIDEVKKAIQAHRPQFVAVELDIKRLHALLSKQQHRFRLSDIRRIGFKGFLFALIGSALQRRLGKMVGIAPGTEMLEAVKLAKANKCNLALIDQDIEITLRRLSQSLGWKERFRFIGDIIRSMVFPKRELRRYGLDKLDLSKVPPEALVHRLTLQLKKRYPAVYNVLIKERNNIMIMHLKHIAQSNPDSTILVVVGAGHKAAIEQAFK